MAFGTFVACFEFDIVAPRDTDAALRHRGTVACACVSQAVQQEALRAMLIGMLTQQTARGSCKSHAQESDCSALLMLP